MQFGTVKDAIDFGLHRGIFGVSVADMLPALFRKGFKLQDSTG